MSYTYKILSRNLFTPSQIDETDITSNTVIRTSFVETLDESLDTGSLTIRGVTRLDPYDMFDTVECYLDGIVKFSMRIAGDSVRLISKNPVTYQHDLTLVEHTKILERYLISGKTFTQPTDGTTEYTLYDVIDILNDTTPFEAQSLVSTTRVFEMPTGDLATYLQSIESPEFTFKEITLREALNQVCGFVEGIPRLNRESDGTLRLTIDFLDEPNDLIDTNVKFINKEKEQDITFYGSSIVSNAQNLVSDNNIDEAVEIYPAEGSWITPRSDKYIFNYEDSYIKTPKRIYNVNKLEQLAYAEVVYAPGTTTIYDFRRRYYYFDTVGDFDSSLDINDFSITTYFVDISTGTTYYWDGGAFQVEVTNPANTTTPKIRLYETFADFTTTTPYTFDVFVDLSTGKTYRYTGSVFNENQNFDNEGNMIFNLTDRVYERNLWNTLDENGADKKDPTKYYKSNTLTYDYRQPNIQLGTTSGLFDTDVDIEIIKSIKGYEMLEEDGYLDTLVKDYTQYTTTIEPDPSEFNFGLFSVHYTPIPSEQRIDIEKRDITDINYPSQLLVNQQARSLNLEHFANNLQGRINRIGNSELQLEHKVADLDSVNYLNIKDYTDDDFIITVRETIILPDYCYVKYGLVKNFNMISKFIGVNSEIRQYDMGENNTISRVVSTKEYCEIDIIETGSGVDGGTHITDDGKKCFMETLKTDSLLEPVRGGWTVTSGSNIPFLTPYSSNGGGNTLMFFQQLDSNAYLDFRNDSLTEPQIQRRFIKYADSVGRAETMQFNLFDKILPTFGGVTKSINDADTVANLDTSEVNKTYVQSLTMLVEKDNREELGALYSVGILSKDINNVILGRKFSTRNRLVNEDAPTTLKLYTYRGINKINKTHDLTINPNYFAVATLSPSNFTFDYVNRTVTLSHPNMSVLNTAWIITDENDNTLLGVNQNDSIILDTITFDFINKRSGIKSKY